MHAVTAERCWNDILVVKLVHYLLSWTCSLGYWALSQRRALSLRRGEWSPPHFCCGGPMILLEQSTTLLHAVSWNDVLVVKLGHYLLSWMCSIVSCQLSVSLVHVSSVSVCVLPFQNHCSWTTSQGGVSRSQWYVHWRQDKLVAGSCIFAAAHIYSGACTSFSLVAVEFLAVHQPTYVEQRLLNKDWKLFTYFLNVFWCPYNMPRLVLCLVIPESS
jgi:hypothetical protein